MTWSCCQSLSPKSATWGRDRPKSFATTVATPRKWPGRRSPHSPFETSLTSTQVWKPGRVDRRRVLRREHQVDAGGAALGQVALEVARVARQVLGRAELRGVHEDGGHARARVGPRSARCRASRMSERCPSCR